MTIDEDERTILSVVQEDRDLAGEFQMMEVGASGFSVRDRMVSGQLDDHPRVQFFARLRLRWTPVPHPDIRTVGALIDDVIDLAQQACRDVSARTARAEEGEYSEGFGIACGVCEEEIGYRMRDRRDSILAKLTNC